MWTDFIDDDDDVDDDGDDDDDDDDLTCRWQPSTPSLGSQGFLRGADPRCWNCSSHLIIISCFQIRTFDGKVIFGGFF